MVAYFGDFPEDATVYIPFNTFTSDDPAASSTITNLADGDIKVHKDGGTTEIATDGATVAIDFDGVTGNHLITVDTSVHADYSTGSDYLVRIEGTTVDGATVNAWVGSFSIENRYMRGTDSANTTTPPTAAAIRSEMDSNSTQLAAILEDTGTTLPGVLGSPSDFGSGTSTLAANLQDMADNGTASFNRSTDSLQAIRDHIGDGSNLTEAGGDGDHLTEAGGTGDQLTAVPWNSSWDAEVQSECTDALNAYDPPTNTEMEARTLASANYATASALTTVDNEIAVIDGIVDDLKSGIIYGAAATGTLSTTQATTDLTGYADDQLIGRHITWLSGDCEGEQTDITDYASTNGLLTFTALTTAPADSDTFKIT